MNEFSNYDEYLEVLGFSTGLGEDIRKYQKHYDELKKVIKKEKKQIKLIGQVVLEGLEKIILLKTEKLKKIDEKIKSYGIKQQNLEENK